MPRLTTTYMGLRLSSPLVPSASPLTRSLDHLKRMEDAGAGAVVLPSLFEEQITQDIDDDLMQGTGTYAEALPYFPAPEDYGFTPDEYLEHVLRAKQALHLPIIASLNGVSAGGWLRYARAIEQAGADALELNVYYIPTAPWLSSDGIEQMYLDLVRDVKQRVRIPVAVKLSPYFTNLAGMAYYLAQAGADALVLFNRFYQPDVDVERLEVVPRLHLSSAHEPQALLLPLRWIAILYGWLQADLAATTGLHTTQDVLKMLLVGAKVTMLASELMTHGVERLCELRAELLHWMDVHGYESLDDLRGCLSQQSVAYPAAFERAQYMRAITQYDGKQHIAQQWNGRAS